MVYANEKTEGTDENVRNEGIVMPVGTVLTTRRGADGGIQDHGVMSWDVTDTEVHRKAKPGETGYVISVDPDNGNMHFVYFHPSEVSVFLSPEELVQECYVVRLGNGTALDIDSLPNEGRDPYVVEQITGEDESGPSPS
jgi:hypothetical protein